MKRPVRVRVVHTRYAHWGAHSGAHQFIGHVDRARCAVSVQTVTDGDDDLWLPREAWRSRLRRAIRRGGMAWYKLSDLAAELRAGRDVLARRVDVVHFLDGEHSAQYLPLLARRSRLLGCRTVATYHQPPELLGDLVRPDVLRALDRIVVVSPTQVEYFTRFVPRERVAVVLHGIDTTFFRPRATPRQPGPFRCITAGHWRRDWAAIRCVARELRDVEFHVVTAQPTGLHDMTNVRTHRHVDDATLLSLYQQADVLLLPLTEATANNALLEGIACGLPVVSTSLPALDAYLPRGEAILVEDNAPEQIIGAIRRLEADARLRGDMAILARMRAQQLSWPGVARQYEKLYASRESAAPALRSAEIRLEERPR